MSDPPGPPGPYPPPPSDGYPPPPPPPPSPVPPFQPGGGPRQGRLVWPWVLVGVAVLLLVVAGVTVLTQGDDDASSVTAERDTTTTESPSTTTTSESPSTTETAVGLIPEEFRVGDCFNDSAHGTNEVGEITMVDCGSAHDAEVFAVATLPGEPAAPYPGDDEVDRLANELCLGEFASYVGIDFFDSAWEFGYFLPTEVSWRKYDDRVVVCMLNDPQFNKIEGSKRNSGT